MQVSLPISCACPDTDNLPLQLAHELAVVQSKLRVRAESRIEDICATLGSGSALRYGDVRGPGISWIVIGGSRRLISGRSATYEAPKVVEASPEGGVQMQPFSISSQLPPLSSPPACYIYLSSLVHGCLTLLVMCSLVDLISCDMGDCGTRKATDRLHRIVIAIVAAR